MVRGSPYSWQAWKVLRLCLLDLMTPAPFFWALERGVVWDCTQSSWPSWSGLFHPTSYSFFLSESVEGCVQLARHRCTACMDKDGRGRARYFKMRHFLNQDHMRRGHWSPFVKSKGKFCKTAAYGRTSEFFRIFKIFFFWAIDIHFEHVMISKTSCPFKVENRFCIRCAPCWWP